MIEQHMDRLITVTLGGGVNEWVEMAVGYPNE